jgi:hypothetical protein
MASIINRLDAALAAMSDRPTKAEVRACFDQVIRYMLLVQLEGRAFNDPQGEQVAKVGNSELLYMLLGDIVDPSPDGVLREMLDRGFRYNLTGGRHPDGAPIEDRNLYVRPRQELPPLPLERERGA